MRRKLLLAVLVIVCAPGPLAGQGGLPNRLPHQVDPVGLATPCLQDYLILPEGTEFEVVLEERVSSATAKPGAPVLLRTADDVVVDGRLVIRKGTHVRGSVAVVHPGGRMGVSGELGLRIESTTAIDGRPIRLRATSARRGRTKTRETAELTSALGPLMMLRRGGEAVYPAGEVLLVGTSAPVPVLRLGLPATAQR